MLQKHYSTDPIWRRARYAQAGHASSDSSRPASASGVNGLRPRNLDVAADADAGNTLERGLVSDMDLVRPGFKRFIRVGVEAEAQRFRLQCLARLQPVAPKRAGRTVFRHPLASRIVNDMVGLHPVKRREPQKGRNARGRIVDVTEIR